MTDRFDLLINAINDNARYILILFLSAQALLASRWTLVHWLTGKTSRLLVSMFDIYIVYLNVYLFYSGK
jgi:hypothetical protein